MRSTIAPARMKSAIGIGSCLTGSLIGPDATLCVAPSCCAGVFAPVSPLLTLEAAGVVVFETLLVPRLLPLELFDPCAAGPVPPVFPPGSGEPAFEPGGGGGGGLKAPVSVGLAQC